MLRQYARPSVGLSARQRELLCRQVIERDGGLCQKCGRAAADIHHIVPRSRAARNSGTVWRIENMACLCLDCHSKAQMKAARLGLLATMGQRYGYDMGWVQEFGIAMEA